MLQIHFYYKYFLLKIFPQPASNLGPLSARQRTAIRMAVRWRADSGPILRAYWVQVFFDFQKDFLTLSFLFWISCFIYMQLYSFHVKRI